MINLWNTMTHCLSSPRAGTFCSCKRVNLHSVLFYFIYFVTLWVDWSDSWSPRIDVIPVLLFLYKKRRNLCKHSLLWVIFPDHFIIPQSHLGNLWIQWHGLSRGQKTKTWPIQLGFFYPLWQVVEVNIKRICGTDPEVRSHKGVGGPSVNVLLLLVNE